MKNGDYLQQILCSATMPIIIWDTKLRISHFNRAAERYSGFSSAEMIGQPIDFLLPEGYRRQLFLVRCQTRNGTREVAVEIPIQCQDGEIRNPSGLP